MSSLQERTLVITNFDPDKTTSRLLKELCMQGGPVKNVVVRPDHAFVEFEDVDSVGYTKALMDGIEMFGRRLSFEPKRNMRWNTKYSDLLSQYIQYDKQQQAMLQQPQLFQQQPVMFPNQGTPYPNQQIPTSSFTTNPNQAYFGNQPGFVQTNTQVTYASTSGQMGNDFKNRQSNNRHHHNPYMNKNPQPQSRQPFSAKDRWTRRK